MHLLWIGTKFPWPPRDGGRAAAAWTIEALLREGVEVTVLAPAPQQGGEAEAPDLEGLCVELVRCPASGSASRLFASLRRPWSLAGHYRPALRDSVEKRIQLERFDCVHVEQIQAFANASPVVQAGVPVVLRSQNVESDLWLGAASLRKGLMAGFLRFEARRLAKAEARILAKADVVVALTKEDSERLSELSKGLDPGSRVAVEIVPVPFPKTLEAGERRLEGNPAIVLFAGGWWPNRWAAERFRRQIWPHVQRQLPGAVLHAFGGDAIPDAEQDKSWQIHPAPPESREVFCPGSILAVPLEIASGVRMKILEAWARGVPTVASSCAVRGLGEGHEQALLRIPGAGDRGKETDEADAWCAAFRRLAEEPRLGQLLIDVGRGLLEEEHAPEKVARRLIEIYGSVGP